MCRRPEKDQSTECCQYNSEVYGSSTSMDTFLINVNSCKFTNVKEIQQIIFDFIKSGSLEPCELFL